MRRSCKVPHGLWDGNGTLSFGGEKGDSLRAVQVALGHKCVTSTEVYQRCILPPGVISPLDALKRKQAASDTNTGQDATARPALFEQPPSVAALDLPFTDDRPENRAVRFYRLLKTHPNIYGLAG